MNAPLPRAATLSPAEAYADAVDARTTLLMAPGAEFWPLAPDNLAEALTEALGDSDNALKAELAAALAYGDSRSTKGSSLLRAELEAYWEPKAKKQAEADVIAAQKAAGIDLMESRADIRKWHADMAMVGWQGMA
jgi:hypothetical protein